MALVNFSNLDFNQIKTTLKDYLRSNSNFTDYDFEGSNLSSILDVLAYNTYITSYNANMVTNEVFIDSATLRENVVALARNIGYVPRSKKSSEANISFFVDTSSETLKPSSLVLRKGPVASSSGSFGNSSFIFSILNDVTVPVFDNIASFNNISVYEGNLLSTSFTVSSFNQQQRFIIPNSGIDTQLINVFVIENGTRVKYRLKNDLFDKFNENYIDHIVLHNIKSNTYLFLKINSYEKNCIIVDYKSINKIKDYNNIKIGICKKDSYSFENDEDSIFNIHGYNIENINDRNLEDDIYWEFEINYPFNKLPEYLKNTIYKDSKYFLIQDKMQITYTFLVTYLE